MGFRFRKSFKIAPGVKVNFGKKGVGTSLGGKGFRVSINSSGRRTTTVGIPGTGISYSSSKGGKKRRKTSSRKTSTKNYSNNVDTEYEYIPSIPWYKKVGWIIASLILLYPLGLFLMWKFTDWTPKTKKIASIAFGIWYVLALIIGS